MSTITKDPTADHSPTWDFTNPESRVPNLGSYKPRIPNHESRILMLAPTPYFADRGCHVRIYEEARTLVELGHDVRIVTYHIGRDMPGVPTCRIPRVPWYGKLAAGPSWHKPYLDLLLFFRALGVARHFRPDIIHAHLHEGALIGALLKPLLRIPLLFDYQGSMTAESLDHGFMKRGGVLHRLFSGIERFIDHRADFIVTSATEGAEALRREWGVPAERVAPLTDGVDTDRFAPGSRDEARRALGLPVDRPVAVFLGLLNRYQGIDLLLEAVRRVRDAGHPLHFLIMGFPEEEYRRRAAAEGVAESITFTGRVDYAEVPRLLAAGDVALSPKVSLTEANGKLLNYMACGLPAVVFETPVNREILGDTGVYARYGDSADFADKLMELVNDPSRLVSLGRAVRERAVLEHSLQARGRELARIYSGLLRSRDS